MRIGSRAAAVLLAGTLIVTVQIAHAATISDLEPNNSIATSQGVDAAFSIVSDPNITNSATWASVSISGTGDGSFDYYWFTVNQAGAQFIFDIDFANFDTELFLYDSSRNLVDSNDDHGSVDLGSTTWSDSYLDHTFATAGIYVIGVGAYNSYNSSGPIGGIEGTAPGSGDRYTLQISTSQPLSTVPLPASLVLLGSGMGLLWLRRRKKAA